MNAQEYFEQVRETVIDIERSKEMLERLLASEGIKPINYDAHTSGGVAGDGMNVVNQRIEFERRLKQRIADTSELLDEANAVLYGYDDHSGLAKAKGNRYADVLCMAYCQAMPWDEIADIMRCSQQWCRELSRSAFKHVDALGFARLRGGK